MEMCRACLSTGTVMVPMDEDFIKQYNMLTSLNITTEDIHLYTCSKCFDRTKLCVEFREKCIESDQSLKRMTCPDTNDNDEKLISVKTEIKLEINDDTEFLETYYNYGEDYVEPTQPNIAMECLNSENVETMIKLTESTKKDYEEPKTELKEKKSLKDRLCKRKYVKKEVDTLKLLCGLCPIELKDKEELSKHLDDHKTDFACGICNESLISVPHMLGHRMEHVPKDQKRCHICPKRFISSENLEFHCMRVHEMAEKDAQIQCKKCLRPFMEVRKLQKHTKHHAERKYKCEHCSKSFLTIHQLNIHIGKHDTKPAFKCDQCDFTCKYSNGLTAHKVRKHTENKAVCRTCGRVFPSRDKLSKHDCRHKLPVVCPVCGITFQAKGSHSFVEHIRSHEAVRHKCAQCPAVFRSRDAFRAHLDKHDGTPRHKCGVCSRAFYSASVLVRHRRIHTGEKPYVCKICSRGFGGNFNLKTHMKGIHGIDLIKKRIIIEETKKTS